MFSELDESGAGQVELAREFRQEIATEQIAEKVSEMLPLYDAARKAKKGETCICPSCEKRFVKKSYQQAFCSNKGQGNCKDYFWNRADEKRAARAQFVKEISKR